MSTPKQKQKTNEADELSDTQSVSSEESKWILVLF